MKGASNVRGVALFSVEETTRVPNRRLGVFVATARQSGGRLRRSVAVTLDNGEPGFAVTMAYLPGADR